MWQCNLCSLHDTQYSIYVRMHGMHLIVVCHLSSSMYVCAAYRDRLLIPKMQTTTAGDEMFILDNSFFYWDLLSGTKFLRYAFLVQQCAPYHVSLLNAPMALNNILSACVQLQYGTVLPSFNLFLCRTIPNAEHSCVGHFTSLLLNVRAFYCRMLDVSASVVHINPALPFHHTLYMCVCKGALTNYVCLV